MRRVDASRAVGEGERPHDGLAVALGFAVVVAHAQCHPDGRRDLERERKHESLKRGLRGACLPEFEAEFRGLAALVAAVDLHDPVFDFQAGQIPDQGLIVEHPQFEEALRHVIAVDSRCRVGFAGGALRKRHGIWALGP